MAALSWAQRDKVKRFQGGLSNYTNSTLADNAAEFGGGLFNSSGGSTVELQNTILPLNTASQSGPDCSGPTISLSNNLIGTTAGCTITLQAMDLMGDPGLGGFTDDGSPGNGHFPLLSTSRAINAGSDAACPPTDQLDQPRVGRCDIGAIEFHDTPVLTVAIDITPGSADNPIDPKSNAPIPVAILSDAFEATTVDPSTVRFGATGTEATPIRFSVEDVNRDGRPDLLLQFRTRDTNIACGDTSASLTGQTFSGQGIEGTDAIQTVGCR